MEQEKKENKQNLTCAETKVFSSYELARSTRDVERAKIESGKSTYTKAKVVRRGLPRTSEGQTFELKLYSQTKPKKQKKTD